MGIDTFGFFLHLGGGNQISLTYVDNLRRRHCCWRASCRGRELRAVFNVVDDELPTSRFFLKSYKREVRKFRSLYVPYFLFYGLCDLWERYSRNSQGQLPPVFNRRFCAFMWKPHRFANAQLKEKLGWEPKCPDAGSLATLF